LKEKAANENRYRVLSRAIEPVDEPQRYYSLMKTLLREIDAVQVSLQQARHGRIRSGVEEMHRVEIFHFQQTHGDDISEYFSDPLFSFQKAKGEAAPEASPLIPDWRSDRSIVHPPVSPTNLYIPPSSPFDRRYTRSLSLYPSAARYAGKLEGASSRRGEQSEVTKTILPALDSSSRESKPRKPAVQHINLAEDDISDSEEVANAPPRDSPPNSHSVPGTLTEKPAGHGKPPSDDVSPHMPPAAVPKRPLSTELSDLDSRTSIPGRKKFLMATADGDAYQLLDITLVESAEDLRCLISQTFGILQSSCTIFRTEYGQTELEEPLTNLHLAYILRFRADAVGSVKIFVRVEGMSGVRQLGTPSDEVERPLGLHGAAISRSRSIDGDVSNHPSAGALPQVDELSEYLQKWTVLDVEEKGI
jgi:hypothetical protein